MQFLLNGIHIQSPSVLLSTCEMNGIDTSLWLGKANSFVDVRGADPSYGYFLVDSEIKNALTSISDNPNLPPVGSVTTPGGSHKAELTIVYDDGTTRVVPNLYLKECVSVTPSLSGVESTYLVKLVDGRFVFSCPEASKFGTKYDQYYRRYNWVETYLAPDELQYEFELDELPELGRFIYDSDSTDEYHDGTDIKVEIGTKDSSAVEITTPINWEELFRAILLVYSDTRTDTNTVFPYFELDSSALELEFIEDVPGQSIFPEWVPQNITLNYSNARNVLHQLLFWTGTSFTYNGLGKFTFFKVKNAYPNGGTVSELDLLFQSSIAGNPADLEHNSNESASCEYPHSIVSQFEILDKQRKDNTKQAYHSIFIPIDVTDQDNVEVEGVGRRSIEAKFPALWIDERGRILSASEDGELPEAEYSSHIREYLGQIYKDHYAQYPLQLKKYVGFHSFLPARYLERVSWLSLGDCPYTQIENILVPNWEIFKPTEVIPRELKLSVIIAKVDGNVEGDQTTFAFKEPKLLVGDLLPTNTAYNTVRRSYVDEEEIVLVGGSFDEWRKQTLLVPDGYEEDELYFTIDDVPYLRLSIPKEKLEEIPSSPGDYKWKVKLEDVSLVNGKIPGEDEDEELEDYIYIKNEPTILLDDSDLEIYIGYDLTVGSNVYNRWTVADARNDTLFLKGLPGYIQNPEEPGTDERRLVLKSPFSATQPIGWLEEAADGRTDEELEQFIITIIEENGGGGGEGGNTTMMYALVDKEGGVASTDNTFNFSDASVLISDGAVLPETGTCDNTFHTPFVHLEPILLLRKNNGMWTAIKIQQNIIRADISGPVHRSDPTFNLVNIVAIQGTVPDEAIGFGDGFEYGVSEPAILVQTNTNRWRVIHRLDMTGIFRTVSTITAGGFNTGTQRLTTGVGTARRMREIALLPGSYEIDLTNVQIRNMTGSIVPANKIIQAKKIGSHWFIDLENCA